MAGSKGADIERGESDFLGSRRCSLQSRSRLSVARAIGHFLLLKSLWLQRQMTLNPVFGPTMKLVISSTGIRAGWS
jgi:hypothetical protein